MTRILLLIITLALASCNECYAGYTIMVYPRITPKHIMVQGAGKLEQALNPGPIVSRPATLKTLIYRPAGFDPYGEDASLRSELWEDDYGITSSADIFATFPALRAWKAVQIRAEGAKRLAALTPYSPEERDTWPQQQAEAKEWRGNQACGCAMIRQIAARRGVSVENLVSKIEENVAIYPAAAGAILGEQQRLLDQIDSATDIDELLAIGWGN